MNAESTDAAIPMASVRVSGRRTTAAKMPASNVANSSRSEEHTSELQSLRQLVCRLLLEKKKHDHRRVVSAYLPDQPPNHRRRPAVLLPLQPRASSRLKDLVPTPTGLPVPPRRHGSQRPH